MLRIGRAIRITARTSAAAARVLSWLREPCEGALARGGSQGGVMTAQRRGARRTYVRESQLNINIHKNNGSININIHILLILIFASTCFIFIDIDILALQNILILILL